MDEKILALHSKNMWKLVDLPPSSATLACWWVFTLNTYHMKLLEDIKVRLVDKGYNHIYDIDDLEAFSLVTCLNFMCILLYIVVKFCGQVHQLDIKNNFMYGDLTEEVYMEKPLCMSLRGECSKVCMLHKVVHSLR